MVSFMKIPKNDKLRMQPNILIPANGKLISI